LKTVANAAIRSAGGRHRRIGILGGSFNPAHHGHLHLSLTALSRLGLDEVWWMVSPQNPLKPVAGMAPFAERLAGARRVAAPHPRIRVTDIETRLGGPHFFTADTLTRLTRRFPRFRFVWLMGADNLIQIRYWARWAEIFRSVGVAVFARPAYSQQALAGLAARRFARQRLPERAGRSLAETTPPAWVFFHSRLDSSSATRIRAAHGESESEPTSLKEQASELAAVTLLPQLPRARSRATAVAREILEIALKTLDDGKAEDIVMVDLAGKTTIADYMVIATARSARQVAALTEHLDEALSPRVRLSIEGKAQADWVLIDASDVIVHLFRPEIRAYYNLEKMWGADLPDVEAARH
jgi:nicotinate (nicotinamide) nucleotide adenylyltransferase/ribosome silencing factor RsfS/YbeB/iojap